MKKLNLINLLLLAGCASTVSSMELFTLNQKSQSIPDNLKVYSCETLKAKSYDVFFSEENQKCLKIAAKELETAEEKAQKAKTNEEKQQLNKLVLKAINKLQNCKATEDLTLEELNKFGTDQQPNLDIINYYKSAYNKCNSSNLFEKNKVNRVNNSYSLVSYLQKQQFSMKLHLAKAEEELNDNKAKEEKLKKFLSSIDSNPVLSKLKETAPDFLPTKFNTMNITCPLVYFIEGLHNFGSITNSTLSSASNYKFNKRNSNTLVMKAGDMEMTFVKSGNTVNLTSMTSKNKKGKTETSTNTLGNNWYATKICLQQQNMH